MTMRRTTGPPSPGHESLRDGDTRTQMPQVQGAPRTHVSPVLQRTHLTLCSVSCSVGHASLATKLLGRLEYRRCQKGPSKSA